jgi:hypothetical protein
MWVNEMLYKHSYIIHLSFTRASSLLPHIQLQSSLCILISASQHLHFPSLQLTQPTKLHQHNKPSAKDNDRRECTRAYLQESSKAIY